MSLLDVERVAAVERDFDPSQPARSGLIVLDAGEVSTVVTHADWPHLVLKRMNGFARREDAEFHATLIGDYCRHLEATGVPCIATQAVVVAGTRTGFSVYVVQPLVPLEELGKTWLLGADRPQISSVIGQLADLCAKSLEPYDNGSSEYECAMDAQLSNWRIQDGVISELLDVTTPLFRREGRLVMDARLLVKSLPPGIRTFIHRAGQVDRIFDIHFTTRGNLLDVIGNLIKESRSDLMPAAIDAANDWLRTTSTRPIEISEVESYYASNARKLELTGRLRGADATVRRILRVPNDSMIPPKVARR